MALGSNSFLLIPTPLSKITIKDPKPLHAQLLNNTKNGAPTFTVRAAKQDNGAAVNDNLPSKISKFFDSKKISEMRSLIPVVAQPSSGTISFGNTRRKDPGTVFVAGAIGQAGVRIAQALLREGFTVRAGVPDLDKAQELAKLAATYKIISSEESRRLYAVESTFENAESIAKAIANAGKVVVTVGPAENGPNLEVTTDDAMQVIQASELAGVGHLTIICDAADVSTPTKNNVFNGISSFFNNLFSRSQTITVAELLEKLVMTDINYTLIKASLTDDFSKESSYSIVVAAEGNSTANDYKVSKSKLASLVADVFSNTAVAENKVVEVSTDPSALPRLVEELFSMIPEDGRRKAYAEAVARAKAEEEAINATEKAREAAAASKMLEQEVKKLSEQKAVAKMLAEEAQKKAEAAGASVEGLMDRAKDISSNFSWEKLSSQISTVVQKPIPKTQIATVRGEAKARKLPAMKAVIKRSIRKPSSIIIEDPTESQAEPKTETRNIFGGLFKQETIYIDDE